jgi:hypothetical protein
MNFFGSGHGISNVWIELEGFFSTNNGLNQSFGDELAIPMNRGNWLALASLMGEIPWLWKRSEAIKGKRKIE